MKQPTAVACITGSVGLHGTVSFCQTSKGVLVTVKIHNLPHNGFFALHIHEGANCRGAGYPNTGGHFNPTGKPHPNHAGDLPPLISCGGEVYLSVLTDRFCLRQVVGRTVVIHSKRDDFTSQPSGDAGTKIGCGVIRA